MVKALVIVEGERRETRFFSRLAEVFGMRMEIVSFRANIYRLYQALKEYGFDYDIRAALLEQNSSEEAKRILSDKYAYTYLVFDCDVQHHPTEPKGALERTAHEVALKNFERLKEMVGYFTNETDPDRGKLYVNYPMMESYRDADEFFDPSFKGRCIDIEAIGTYKTVVSKRKLSRFHENALTRNEVMNLVRMHLYKLLWMMAGEWRLPAEDEYERYGQLEVEEVEREECVRDGRLQVLNTSVFLAVDYLGSKGFLMTDE